MKRLFACIMLLSCSLFVIPVYGNQPETVVTSAAPALDLSAKSAVVMEAGSGTILYAKEKDIYSPMRTYIQHYSVSDSPLDCQFFLS